MKNLIIQIELPEGIDLNHLHQSVMDAIFLPENVTNEESRFIDNILCQVIAEAEDHQKIAVIWSVEDVLGTAEDMEDEDGNPIELTEDQAVEALLLTEKYHDANDGISWDSIRSAIETVISK